MSVFDDILKEKEKEIVRAREKQKADKVAAEQQRRDQSDAEAMLPTELKSLTDNMRSITEGRTLDGKDFLWSTTDMLRLGRVTLQIVARRGRREEMKQRAVYQAPAIDLAEREYASHIRWRAIRLVGKFRLSKELSSFHP